MIWKKTVDQYAINEFIFYFFPLNYLSIFDCLVFEILCRVHECKNI